MNLYLNGNLVQSDALREHCAQLDVQLGIRLGSILRIRLLGGFNTSDDVID